jgi:hypothetical protein
MLSLTPPRHTSTLPFRQQIFDIAKAQREPKIEPNRLLNDLRREPVSVLAGMYMHR